MGNKIARTTQASATEYYLHDLPSSYNLVLKEVLGRGRFFKSIQCKHDEGLVLVKVYFKRGDQVDLRDNEKRLFFIKDTFRNIEHSHVWPFQFWLETDKAAYLLRQFFFNNLHDRLSTQPFLSLVEKKWLSFQLLCAVKQSHDHGICHGDIKCENVLVTSWNWVYLADFASFKPTYIPDDDPSDFSFFFDTGGRRLCYLAPERFYEHGGDMPLASDAPLKPSMDIFALGCVIAELFLEGQPLFELSQLLAYRRGQFDPSQHLEKIPDAGIQKMILHMIQLNPDERLSAEGYLQSYAGVVFPNYFSPFLHNFYSCLNSLDSDAKVVMCQSAFHEIVKQMTSGKPGDETSKANEHGIGCNSATEKTTHPIVVKQVHGYPKGTLAKDFHTKGSPQNRFDLLGDLGSLLRDVDHSNHFSSEKSPQNASKTNLQKQDCNLQSPSELLRSICDVFKRREHAFLKRIAINDLQSLLSEYDSESDVYRMPFLDLPPDDMCCEGMVLITSLLCSCIRNVKFPQLRRSCILLLKSSSVYIDDEDRLQRVLPYVIAMLSDPTALVRCAALETLCDILPLVQDFPPSDAKIFPVYILPMLSTLPDDAEESVRICYASNISKLALTAYGFLIRSIRMSEAGKSTTPLIGGGQAVKVSSNGQLNDLRKSIGEVVQELVMGPKQTPNIRRALLQDIAGLCCFFGQRQSNDFMLPILPAFLNDRDEQLRTEFYREIVYVCFFVGQKSVEEYLLPYIEQALSDTAEGVIVNTLDCLTALCNSAFLRKRILLEMIQHAFPLLCYPSQWVRRSVASFIAASSENLGAVDSHVFLAPVVRPFLRRQPASLASKKDLLSCLKPPVSRQVFYQVLENARGSDMLERQRKIWYNTSTQQKQRESVDLPKKNEDLLSLKAWAETDQETLDSTLQGSLVDQLEMTECDSIDLKLRTLKGYISNSASTLDIRDHLSPEKLQFSGLISPQLNGVNSFMHDRSPENIPLYSFSLDKREAGNSQTASDTSMLLNSFALGSSSARWLDQVNKPFGMASSVPAPKLVSGSFSIASGSKQFHRVVHEPEAKESEQTSYMIGKFQDLGTSGSVKGSVGSLEDVSAASEIAGAPSVSWTSALPDSGWKPKGVLVAHLQEHRSAVNEVAVSTDHSFFVSASDDSTVKVWDSRKLEKDISFRSRLTYPLEGSRALCATMLQGSGQVVVGACDGRLHMFSVDHISKGLGNVVEKYSGIVDVKKKDIGEGAILSVVNLSTDAASNHVVMYSTQNCGIHIWDTRTNTNSWTLKATPEEGYISTLVSDPCGTWFLSGSSRGVLTLWDLRFLIPVNSWEYPRPCPIENMCLYVPPPNTPFSTMARPLVYVAAGCNEVSLWNAETGSCHQVFCVQGCDGDTEMSDLPWALARPPIKTNPKPDPRKNVNLKYRVNELNEPPPRLSGIRSLLPLPGGDLLTGGTDLKIRRWDHSRPERSYCICGPTIKGLPNDELYESKSSFGVQVVQEMRRRPLTSKLTTKAVLAAAATDSAGCHRDSVLSLASVKLNQRLLISSSRDGAIKVWK